MAKDFAEGLYDQNSGQGELPRTESGSLRVAAFTAPCRTSKELEARAAYHFANPIDVVFIGEDGTEEIAPMTPTEKAELSKHFSVEEWMEIEKFL